MTKKLFITFFLFCGSGLKIDSVVVVNVVVILVVVLVKLSNSTAFVKFEGTIHIFV